MRTFEGWEKKIEDNDSCKTRKAYGEIRCYLNYIVMSKEDLEFEKAVEVVIKYMAENHHPHTTIIIDATSAQLLEGLKVHNTEKYLVD